MGSGQILQVQSQEWPRGGARMHRLCLVCGSGLGAGSETGMISILRSLFSWDGSGEQTRRRYGKYVLLPMVISSMVTRAHLRTLLR